MGVDIDTKSVGQSVAFGHKFCAFCDKAEWEKTRRRLLLLMALSFSIH